MAQKRKAAAKGRGGRRAANGGRNEQVVRILQLIRALDRTGGCDVYELSQHFGIGVRTVRRDLVALEASGIPIKREAAEDSSRVRYAFDGDATERVTSLFEAAHFLALRVAMTEGTVLRQNSHLFATIEELAKRIEDTIGPRGREQLREIDRCFFSWDKFAWRKAPRDVLLPLVSAISGHRVCEVRYRAPTSGNKERKYQVLPLRLFVHNGALYLHAWHAKLEQVRLLNLNRLVGLKVLEQRQEPPASYDPGELEATAFGIFIGPAPEEVVLRFDAFARPYIEERTWHPSQELTPEKDGGVKLSFRCPPSYEVDNWVASWKDHVEVLAPTKLRQELATYGAWLTARYAQ